VRKCAGIWKQEVEGATMFNILRRDRPAVEAAPVVEGPIGPVRLGRQIGCGGHRLVWMDNPTPQRLHPDVPNWSSVLRFDAGSGIWPHTQLSGCDGFRGRMSARVESKFFRHRRGVLLVFVRDPDAPDRSWQTHRLDTENKYVFVPPEWCWGACTATVDESAICELHGHPSIFKHHDEGGNSYRVKNDELPELMRERIKLGFVSKLSRTPNWDEDRIY